MGNVIVLFIILAIVSAAIIKIVVDKRKGAKCIGCPYSKASNGCHCKK